MLRDPPAARVPVPDVQRSEDASFARRERLLDVLAPFTGEPRVELRVGEVGHAEGLGPVPSVPPERLLDLITQRIGRNHRPQQRLDGRASFRVPAHRPRAQPLERAIHPRLG